MKPHFPHMAYKGRQLMPVAILIHLLHRLGVVDKKAHDDVLDRKSI